MAKGAQRGKGLKRRLSKRSGGSTGASSGARKPKPSSAAKEGGEGRTFSIRATKSPGALMSEARKVAKENGASFRGDANTGSFSGKGVKGRYKIEGGTVKVTITDKPTLASWFTVESRVKEFFES